MVRHRVPSAGLWVWSGLESWRCILFFPSETLSDVWGRVWLPHLEELLTKGDWR